MKPILRNTKESTLKIGIESLMNRFIFTPLTRLQLKSLFKNKGDLLCHPFPIILQYYPMHIDLRNNNWKDFSGIKTSISDEKSRWPYYLFLLFIFTALFSYQFIPEFQNFLIGSYDILKSNDKEKIEEWISDFSWFGPFLLVLAMILQMFLFIIPTTLILIVCILAYGPWWGSLLALLAMYSASSVGYLIGRYFGSAPVERMLGKSVRLKVEDFLIKHGFWAIFITRLNPFLSNDAVSLASGILKIGYWKFCLASIAGVAPLIFCIAFFGEGTQTLLYLLVGSGIILVILIGYKIILKRRVVFFPDANK